MKRYILTGTSGCGKTSIIRDLEMRGYDVINESATDIIADQQMQGNVTPWEKQSFIDDIIKLQKRRQINDKNNDSELHFYDRSPICTYALSIYLGFKPSVCLMNEIKRIARNNIYEKRVFFIENLGFLINTNARKISFQDSLNFEKIHREVYKEFGYEFTIIPPGSVVERVEIILKSV